MQEKSIYVGEESHQQIYFCFSKRGATNFVWMFCFNMFDQSVIEKANKKWQIFEWNYCSMLCEDESHNIIRMLNEENKKLRIDLIEQALS